MEGDNAERLGEVLDLVQENNRILRKMLRSARWGLFFSSVKWVLVIGSAIGLYYFLQPAVDRVISTYNAIPGIEDLNFFNRS